VNATAPASAHGARHGRTTLHATNVVAQVARVPANPGTPNPSVGFNGF
jgi:hypothetical protein